HRHGSRYPSGVATRCACSSRSTTSTTITVPPVTLDAYPRSRYTGRRGGVGSRGGPAGSSVCFSFILTVSTRSHRLRQFTTWVPPASVLNVIYHAGFSAGDLRPRLSTDLALATHLKATALMFAALVARI